MKYLWRTLLIIVLIIIITAITILIAGSFVTYDAPIIALSDTTYQIKDTTNYKQYGESHIRKSNDGLWELYLSGTADQRGIAYANLASDLIRYQEDIFIDQIHNVIQSDTYISILQRIVRFFNRDLDKYIPIEYKHEIYGISQACSNKYDFIGNGYERQLNYHAAHDIGHAMQDYMLVGCSSFAAWGQYTTDSSLVIGRNFDFYFGEDFARNKIIQMVRPTEGIPFVSISWPAFIGVASGMNINGLTITINAAKGQIPTTAKTPISILARQILQYASTIEEAIAIANQYETFVSESLLIASARDSKAIIIEKTPDKMSVFETNTDYILSTNHYQSEAFSTDERNNENIQNSDSKYRLERLNELIEAQRPINEISAANILRDRYGKANADIGISNEKSINQFISHHSVIFKPQQLQMWVSTSPWQMGKYICYDIKKIFSGECQTDEIAMHQLDIPTNDSLLNDASKKILFEKLSNKIKEATNETEIIKTEEIDSIININKNYYYTYELIGDYYKSINKAQEAKAMYNKALTLEIPQTRIKERIETKSTEIGE